MEPIIQERVDEWIAINRRYADEGKEINWYDWCQSLAYDVVGDLVFGKKFGFVETESDVDNLLHSFYETVPLAGFIIRIPWLMKFISNGPLGPYILPNPKDKTGLGHLQAVCAYSIGPIYLRPSLISSDPQ